MTRSPQSRGDCVYRGREITRGRWLATASSDNTARLWIWRVEDLIDLACATAGCNMSRVEWRRYFADQPYRRTCEQWPEGK